MMALKASCWSEAIRYDRVPISPFYNAGAARRLMGVEIRIQRGMNQKWASMCAGCMEGSETPLAQ